MQRAFMVYQTIDSNYFLENIRDDDDDDENAFWKDETLRISQLLEIT